MLNNVSRITSQLLRPALIGAIQALSCFADA
jgi:hypothetical protein